MNKPLPFLALLTAVAATVLIASTAAVFVFISDFFLFIAIERALESVGVLARGWSAGHEIETAIAAAIFAVPVVTAVAIWMFRRACAGERELG